MARKSASLQTKWWDKELTGKVTRFKDGFVVCSDALTLLRQLPPRCADIVFLDPPFNLGKRYGARSRTQDRVDDFDYKHYINSVISRATTVLRPGGALYLYHIPRCGTCQRV